MTNLTKHGLKLASAPGALAESAKTYHLNQTVVIPAGKAIVETSGHIGFGEDGKLPGDVKTEFYNAFKNVDTSLKHAGVEDGFKSVFHINTYHTSFADEHMAALDAAAEAFFGPDKPTWTGVQVVNLSEGASLEIEVRAVM